MYPKGGKPIPMDEYYCSVADYLKRKMNIRLYIGFKENILYPELPAFFD